MPLRERKIEFHQVLRDDGSVHSHQWTALPDDCAPGLTVEEIVERYLAFLRSCTLGLVRPLRTADSVAIRFLGLRLISLCLPVVTSSGTATSADLFINGGLLVQRDSCNRGQLRFTIVSDPGQIRVEIRLSDYCPLLLGTHAPSRFRKWLYHITQASIHNVVTVRFLAHLCSDLTGKKPPLNVVKTSLSDGEDI
ncbi:MAG: hypothetical protein WC007_15100 [Pelobacteraceae bacterium]